MKILNKKVFLTAISLLAVIIFAFYCHRQRVVQTDGDYIKWMEFNASQNALQKAMEYDIASNADDYPISWIDLIAYCAVKSGNNFKKNSLKSMDEFVQKIKNGMSVEEITQNLKYFDYYKTTYSAVLGNMLGDFAITDSDGNTKIKYGIKAFLPIAEGYAYNHYDDFGSARSYGFRRRHLGNDLMASIGTPVIAVESGTVEALGWNRYGGWRIGIRSFDKKRYYYYAHLRKDAPYAKGLKEGSEVVAGDVIGYVGMTGYSNTENVNNINIPHLHFGMQIIFDESQKDGNGEIWIDTYNIINLLNKNRATLVSDGNGVLQRKYKFKDLERRIYEKK